MADESAKSRLRSLLEDRRNRQHWFTLEDLAKEFDVTESYIEQLFRELHDDGFMVEKRNDEGVVMYKGVAPL